MAIGGPSIPLPYPTNPWPAQPQVPGVSSSVWTNVFRLLRATSFLIPPGRWGISTGTHSFVQILDPVTNTWVPLVTASTAFLEVTSDGTNYRIANISGTPVDQATVTAAGTGYVQSTTTVTSSAGGSTWVPLVDGTVSSYTVGNDKNGVAGGSNFTIPPVVIVQAPPTPGIQATAHATLSSGAVATVAVDNAGAGYGGLVPGVMLIPDPADPNAGIITIPAITAVMAAAVGAITGILLGWHGTSQGSAPTLTVNGAGSSATATVTLAATAGDDTITMQWLGGVG